MSAVKSIAITRPLEDAVAIANTLKEQGHKVFLVPMLRIMPLSVSANDVAKAFSNPLQAIIITSKHAAAWLGQQEVARNIPVFAVGEGSAAVAVRQGFSFVHAAGNSVASLLTLIKTRCKAEEGGRLLYVRGEDISTDLAGELGKQQYDVHELVVYKAEPVERVPEEYVRALQNNAVDEVWFYSLRSARNYNLIMQHMGLKTCHSTMTACFLSERMLQEAGDVLPWKHLMCCD